MEETPLHGGSVNSVVKIGNTVRRKTGHWTPAVHKLLEFLNRSDFKFAPKLLGIDEKNREILEYIPGKVGTWPWPKVLLEDQGLIESAKVLKNYHDAVSSFSPTETKWMSGTKGLGRDEIIRHGDLGPWNMIWEKDKIVGLIDWDSAEPGKRITDLAQMAWYYVPLNKKDFWKKVGFRKEPDYLKRLEILCKEYGGEYSAKKALDELVNLQEFERARIADFGQKGIYPWSIFFKRGYLDELQQEKKWLNSYRKLMGI